MAATPMARHSRTRPQPGRAGPVPETGPPEVPPPPPLARAARPAARHRGLALAMVLVVVMPVIVVSGYLFFAAQDQYASRAGFTIRQDDSASASDILGGMSQLLSGSGGSHADLLFEYLHSQELVMQVDARLDLRAHFALAWPRDPVFALPPRGSVDQLVRFWQRILRVSFDRNTGLLLVEARANDPAYAREIILAIVASSEAMINQLNLQARRDRMRLAEADLQQAVTRLRTAREDLAEFRARTQIVDPEADIQGRMGVLNNLQQKLAEALVEHDLLALITDANDPRLRQSARRVDVIRERIVEERATFARQDTSTAETDYPRLIAQFESLLVEQEIAQQGYGAALRALDLARSNAERQSLFVALFIRPTLTQEPGYPKRLLLIGMTALFSLLVWVFGALAYYSLRDRT